MPIAIINFFLFRGEIGRLAWWLISLPCFVAHIWLVVTITSTPLRRATFAPGTLVERRDYA